MTTLTVEAEDGEEVLLGKAVSELQSDVEVTDGAISGTLHYVEDYTGYSGDPTLQSGNFLALRFEAAEGATVTLELVGGSGVPVTLDEDMQAVIRVTDPETQSLKVSVSSGGETESVSFELGGLTCEDE